MIVDVAFGVAEGAGVDVEGRASGVDFSGTAALGVA